MEDHSLEISPVVLELTGQTIVSERSTPLYHITGSVTTTAQKDSTIKLEQVHHGPEPQAHHIFYLVHPVDARYRTDLPAQYYMTCAAPGMNGKTARDQPLFNDGADQQLLFTAKPDWKGYIWMDATGRHVASEDKCRLAILIPLRKDLADALVALWMLRVWFDMAESSQAKREFLEHWTPPDGHLTGVKSVQCSVM